MLILNLKCHKVAMPIAIVASLIVLILYLKYVIPLISFILIQLILLAVFLSYFYMQKCYKGPVKTLIFFNKLNKLGIMKKDKVYLFRRIESTKKGNNKKFAINIGHLNLSFTATATLLAILLQISRMSFDIYKTAGENINPLIKKIGEVYIVTYISALLVFPVLLIGFIVYLPYLLIIKPIVELFQINYDELLALLEEYFTYLEEGNHPE